MKLLKKLTSISGASSDESRIKKFLLNPIKKVLLILAKWLVLYQLKVWVKH